MRVRIYQVDAFASRLFTGNPAAVCPLEEWLPEELLQAIGAENNLAETAFVVPRGEEYELRWFTPTVEVDLCGHATLAAAFVLFRELSPDRGKITFHTRSGPLAVRRKRDLLTLDFPALTPAACPPPEGLAQALGAEPREVLAAMDYLAVYDSEEEIRTLRPDMERLKGLDRRGVIATAPGRETDFVSRFFAPACGIPEDPVTGSAHCTLAPYWSARLGRSRLRACQASPRGGDLECEVRGDRVLISGRAVLYLEGTIQL